MALSKRHDDGLVGWALIFAFVVAIFFLVLSRDNARLRYSSSDTLDSVNSPVIEILSRPVRSLENLIFGFRDRARAFEENKVLRAELAVLREELARSDALQLKVDRYEQILGQSTPTEIPLKKIAARAVSENNGPFVWSVLINVGKNQGVSEGNPVMSADGLIGHVISAGSNSSRVLLLSDLNSRIAVMSREDGVRAIMSGDNTRRPLLAYINNESTWEEGDIVVTSGDEGILPMGLPVGVAAKDSDGRLRVKAGAESTPLDWVWVSPYVPVEPPVEEDVPDTASDGPVNEEAP